jgi:hypothetical protein
MNENEMVFTYLTSIAAVNESTAIKYNERLKKFGLFVFDYYNNSSVDNIVIQTKKNKINVYDILGAQTFLMVQLIRFTGPMSQLVVLV